MLLPTYIRFLFGIQTAFGQFHNSHTSWYGLKKASVLAEASDVKLGKIINIDYSWGEIDFVSKPLQEMSLRCCEPIESYSASYDMDIEPDDIDITDTVTVVWALED